MTENKRVQVGLKLPSSLVQQVDAERPEGVSRTEFIEQAVREKLNPRGGGLTAAGTAPPVALRVPSSLAARAGVRPIPKAGKK